MSFHADFHCHLGGSTPLSVIEKHTGISARVHLEREAKEASAAGSLAGFLGKYFSFIEDLQSDVRFIEDSAYGAMMNFIGPMESEDRGVYELRFCPFIRKAPVMDQILAVKRGMDRASEQSQGRFTPRLIIIAQRGSLDQLNSLADEQYWPHINGIDVAGVENSVELLMPEWLLNVEWVYTAASRAGLQTTYHSGEVYLQDTLALLQSHIPLTRIGHGVKLRYLDKSQLARLLERRRNIVFELCPAINHRTGSATFGEVVEFAAALKGLSIPFVFGSDNPVITGVDWATQLRDIPHELVCAARQHSENL